MNEDYYKMTEENYFSLTEEERDNLATIVVRRINEKEIFNIHNNFVLSILKREMEYALHKEDYMICDALTRIMDKYNEKAM